MKKGHKMTLEQREKMSQAKLGARNPRFGKVGTCLGRKQTPEQIVKIRAARAKQVITDEHKRNISLGLMRAYNNGTRKVEDNIWWKGGITPINKQLRRTQEYKLWREAVFKRDNWTCQECNVRGGEIQADHIKPFALYSELRTSIENGRTLCRSCHLKTPTFGLRYDLVISQRTQS